MSESKNEAAEPKPEQPPAEPGKMQKVDEAAQKDAAQERASEGGYD